MNKQDKKYVKSIINNEGFNYTFEDYSDFEEIKDEKFHILRLKLLQSIKKIKDYIGYE